MDITVMAARLIVEGERRWWNLLIEIDPGGGDPPKVMAHLFPEDIFEWRVAEYGIDPADTDTLLQVVLYEPHLDPETVDPDLTHIAAPSVAAARRHHLDRVRQRMGAAGLRGGTRQGRARHQLTALSAPVVVDSGQDDPLAVLKREMVLSHPHIDAKRDAVDYHREHARRERQARVRMAREWRRETPEQERHRLLPTRSGGDISPPPPPREATT